MNALDLSRTIVKQFPPRSVQVKGDFLNVPRELLGDLEETLARMSGERVTNHAVYQLVYDGPFGLKTTYIWFHDSIVVFGNVE